MPAANTTIVGGRPPGSGRSVGIIPRGIEVLVKKAAVDAEFRQLLLARRAEAAKEIGLVLTPTEVQMLTLAPAEQLEAIITRTKVEPSQRPAFMGKAAAVMLVALGAAAMLTDGCYSTGSSPDVPPPVPQATQPAPQPEPPGPTRGIQPDQPPGVVLPSPAKGTN